MSIRKSWAVMGILAIGAILAFAIVRMGKPDGADGHGQGHGEAGHDGDEPARGPHGCRLFEAGETGMELCIYETGVPPQFRAYLYRDDKPAAPAGAELAVELHRLGGRVDTIRFAPQGDFLLGDRTVEEPHSFGVKIRLREGGRSHAWEYAQEEGRVVMDSAAAAASGIAVEPAGPARMRATLPLNGKVIANEDRLAHIFARFPGVVKEVRKHLGEAVSKGETLAIIESNESLEAYPVVSQIAGTVIRKHITAGETVGSEEELFAITDLGTVWADFSVYRQDFPRLRKGQKVVIDAGDGSEPVEARLEYLSPIGAENTQTMTARAPLANRDGRWPPGLFVKGRAVLEEFPVAVAVKAEALQTFRDWDVVFVNVGDVYEARPVETGRRDGDRVEILAGLAAGERVVVGNSYAIKADIGKAGASHDH